MQELAQLLGLLAALVSIALKVIITNNNALSFSSSSSLGSNPIFFSLHSITSGTRPITAVSPTFAHIPVLALPECTHNSTLPGCSKFKYNDSAPVQIAGSPEDDFVFTTTYGETDVFVMFNNVLKQVAHASSKFIKATLSETLSKVWRSWLARRMRRTFRRWALSIVIFLDLISDPEVHEALKLVIDALARFWRKRAGSRRYRKPINTRRKYPLHPNLRYYKAPYFNINDLDGAYSLIEMPLVFHSSLGNGIIQRRWHTPSLYYYSIDDMMPEYIEHAEHLFEIRLPHCVGQERRQYDRRGPPETGIYPSGRGAQWTYHVRKTVVFRIDNDWWGGVVASKEDVYFAGNEFMDTVYTLEDEVYLKVSGEI